MMNDTERKSFVDGLEAKSTQDLEAEREQRNEAMHAERERVQLVQQELDRRLHVAELAKELRAMHPAKRAMLMELAMAKPPTQMVQPESVQDPTAAGDVG